MSGNVIQKIAPCKALKPFIDCYWWFEPAQHNDAFSFTYNNMLPEGIFELIIQVEGSSWQSSDNEYWIKRPTAFVGGLFERKYAIRPEQGMKIFGVRFLPNTARHFIAAPLIEFKNKVVGLEEAFGKTGKVLEQQLEVPSEQLIATVESFLLHQLHHQYKEDVLIDKMVSTIMESPPSKLHSVAEKFAVHERRFRRLFHQHVGLSPKSFSRVVRLNRFLQLQQQQQQNLTQCTYELGYYDQAHFSRDFKQFTGLSPGNFNQFNRQFQLQLK